MHALCALECGLVSRLPPQEMSPRPAGAGVPADEIALCCTPFLADSTLPLHPMRLASSLVGPRTGDAASPAGPQLYAYCAAHKLPFPGRLEEGAQEANEEWDAEGWSGTMQAQTAGGRGKNQDKRGGSRSGVSSAASGGGVKRARVDAASATAMAASLAFGGDVHEVRPVRDLLAASLHVVGAPFVPVRRIAPLLGPIVVEAESAPAEAAAAELALASSLTAFAPPSAAPGVGPTSVAAMPSAIAAPSGPAPATAPARRHTTVSIRAGPFPPLLLPCSARRPGGPPFVPLVRVLVTMYGHFVNVAGLNTARAVSLGLQPLHLRRRLARLQEQADAGDEAGKAELKRALHMIFGKNCFIAADPRAVLGEPRAKTAAGGAARVGGVAFGAGAGPGELAGAGSSGEEEDEEPSKAERSHEAEQRDEARFAELEAQIAALQARAAEAARLAARGEAVVANVSPSRRASVIFARSFLGFGDGQAASEFCICKRHTSEQMVGCDSGDQCPWKGWLHLSCAGLAAAPAGDAEWRCRDCAAAAAAALPPAPFVPGPEEEMDI